MKKQALFIFIAAAALTACGNASSESEEVSSVSTQASSSSESVVSSAVESQESPFWASMEEAIAYYEAAITKELGEDLANIELGGEYYERSSWQLLEHTGDTIVLTLKNVGRGGRNAIEFVKGDEVTTITVFEVDTPYPEAPISRRTVRHSDMVTISTENLRPENEASLSDYSAAEIEYARVWLEVIGNKTVEELNVSSLPAGEPINAYEPENSAVYPEEVVVLSGKTMADGTVVYGSNGDGTINWYQVPSHWQVGVLPEGRTMLDYTSEIAANPVLVPISTGSEADVIALMEKIQVPSSAVITPFTAAHAFAYLKEQEGFSEDLALKYSSYQAEGNYYELVIISRSLQAQGGSGTVGIYNVYEDGRIVDTYAD